MISSLIKTFCCVALITGASLILHESRSDAGDLPKENSASSTPNSGIIVKDCRVKLIDRVILGSDRPGVLEYVEPSEGEKVKKGQEIAALKTDSLQASRKTAEMRATNDIEIRYSKKASETSNKELEINLDINKRTPGTISILELERLKLNAEKSFLQIEQAQMEYEMNKLQLAEIDAQLKETKIIAPFDGIVTKKFRSTGEVVRHGDEVLELVSTKRVKVEGHVNIADTWKFNVGTPVEVKLNIPEVHLPIEEATYHGKISFIDVEVEPVDVNKIRVWAEVENAENILKAGYMATMRILPEKSGNKVAQKSLKKK